MIEQPTDNAAAAVPDAEFRTSALQLASCLASASALTMMRDAMWDSPRFDHAFDTASAPMQLVDGNGVYRRVNQAFADFIGYETDQLVGKHWREFTHVLDRDKGHQDASCGFADHHDEANRHEVKRYVRSDGKVVWGSLIMVPVDDGESGFHLTQIVDVSPQIAVIERAVEAQHDVQDAAEQPGERAMPMPDPVLRLNPDAVVLDCNAAAESLFAAALVGRRFDDVLEANSRARVRMMIDNAVSDARSQRIDRVRLQIPSASDERWYTVRVVPELAAGSQAAVHLVLSDMTQHVHDERRLTALALTDPLTGIANRAATYDRLDRALLRLKRDADSGVAVLAIDIDRFKTLNDVYGHGFGDATLAQFAEQASAAVRENDTVGRIGGDEFVVVLESVESVDAAHQTAERICGLLNPFTASVGDGPSADVTISVGMAWTSEAVDAPSLVAAADEHLRLAKRNGRGRLWTAHGSSDVSPKSGHVTRSRLIGELQHAIDNEEFVLHYQPLVDRDDQLVAVEALVRWQHPERGLVAPDTFVPVLIETGQIAVVGTWVMRTAIDQVASWREEHRSDLRLNINASAGEIGRVEYRRALQENVSLSGIEPGVVNVELTEQALSGSAVSESAMEELSSFGVNLVLDDFGTGISSLTHLRTASLAGVKIDRSFVSNTLAGDVDRRIVSGVTRLAHEVGVEVTAEGVETEEQSDWIRSVGCDYLQGYYFSRPLSTAAMSEVMRGATTLGPTPSMP